MDGKNDYHRKRKIKYGSEEKEKKYTRSHRCEWYFNDKDTVKYTKSEEKASYRFQPSVTSSAEKKSWAEMMDEEDELCKKNLKREKDNLKSRRKIPLQDVNNENPTKTVNRKALALPLETDERKIATRQRQIDIGKNTPGYNRYIEDVSRLERTSKHPWTPNKYTVCSTRSWQGVMKIWRRKLHYWDPPEVVAQRKDNCFLNISTSTTESEDVSSKPPIDDSMEADGWVSSEGSQASSNGDFNGREESVLSDEIDMCSFPFVY